LTLKTSPINRRIFFKHSHDMKKSLIWAIVGIVAFAFSTEAIAQDDLYYDPATDARKTKPVKDNYSNDYREDNNLTRRYRDEDAYYDEDDYAYEYSSRIRRFHRRSYVVDYYDPFFVDLYNYDPSFAPGTSIYVYNFYDYWSWRRWNRWQRWNRCGAWNSWDYGWGMGWNTWGWNSCYAWNRPWYNPWVINNYYYDPYWTWNGFNPYYGNVWVNNHYYYNNNQNQGGGGGGYAPKTYTGPRRGGTQVNPGYARIPDGNGRLATAQDNVPTLERTSARPGRTATDMEAAPNNRSASDRSVNPSTGGRRPEGSNAEPGRTRQPDAAPSGRNAEPSRRNEDATSPRRTDANESPRTPRTDAPTRRGNDEVTPRRQENTEPARPPRTETPTRRGGGDEGYSPRRTESAPSRGEDARPTRRSEEQRSYERPSRFNDNSGGSIRESRPSPSRDSGTRSGGGSVRSGWDSGGSRSPSSSGGGRSPGSSGGGRIGGGGRN
jgi:hypothetical protein